MGIWQFTHVAEGGVKGNLSTKFPVKVSFSGASKPAGGSESEPTCSLVRIKLEVPTL